MRCLEPAVRAHRGGGLPAEPHLLRVCYAHLLPRRGYRLVALLLGRLNCLVGNFVGHALARLGALALGRLAPLGELAAQRLLRDRSAQQRDLCLARVALLCQPGSESSELNHRLIALAHRQRDRALRHWRARARRAALRCCRHHTRRCLHRHRRELCLERRPRAVGEVDHRARHPGEDILADLDAGSDLVFIDPALADQQRRTPELVSNSEGEGDLEVGDAHGLELHGLLSVELSVHGARRLEHLLDHLEVERGGPARAVVGLSDGDERVERSLHPPGHSLLEQRLLDLEDPKTTI
mmetsp:Transcript_24041/g.57105  ORF Transcript_24041/g.57105 Transcript_24041/m.57105 type:complete len:296 (-) Transcript_24041:1075-1962(-)